MKIIAAGTFYFAIGSMVMLGFRAVEYAIPAPETRVLICMIDEAYTVETCKSLKEISEKIAERERSEK